MNIGIVTHGEVINYGANLQALSTACYIKNSGNTPVFINWNEYVNETISKYNINDEQYYMHTNFLRNFGFEVTKPCKTEDDFVSEINKYSISLILVGSDAVLTVASYLDRIVINKKGISLRSIPLNYKFPNPFWIPYYTKLHNVKLKFMSPSCQSCRLNWLSLRKKKQMKSCLRNFSVFNARDSHTANMIKSILHDKSIITITPDPVFAFNQNVSNLIQYNREDILAKYNLPKEYICISFYGNIDNKWLLELKESINKRGWALVLLPMPQGSCISIFDVKIELPLNSIDWYYIIKYSKGYIGHNMHPIIVSIHNLVPFFSIDQHGKNLVSKFDKSSKVYDLLSRYNLLDYRIRAKKYKCIEPEYIIKKIETFDLSRLFKISEILQESYNKMMENLLME